MTGTTHINYTLRLDHKLLFTTYGEKDVKMLLHGGGVGRDEAAIGRPLQSTPHELKPAMDSKWTGGQNSSCPDMCICTEIPILRQDLHKIVNDDLRCWI